MSRKSAAKCRRKVRHAALAATLSLPLPLPLALAQEEIPAEPAPVDAIPVDQASAGAEAPAEEGGTHSRIMEEIVVTAQKREENVQDVPISIAAFSAEALDARGVVGIKDLALATPGLQFTDLAGYTLIYLRGVGTDAFIPSAEPSIATYVDGIYFPSAHSLSQSFGALERVEVLKGPQGTLFGRNSTGGAINVITKEPDDEFENELQLSYGRFNDFKGRAFTSIPLTDTFATSISVVYNLADPYYRRDNADGRELLTELTRGARVKLRWYPTDNFEFRVTGIRAEQNGSQAALTANTHPSPLFAPILPAETRDYVTTADSFPSLRIDTKSLYGTAIYKLDWFDVKASTSYYHVKAHDYTYDFDATDRPLVTFIAEPEFQTIKSSELQVTSSATSWGAEHFKWVGGIYHFESHGGYDPAFLSLANSLISLPTGGVVDLIPQQLRDQLGVVPSPTSIGLYFRGVLGTNSNSAYLQGTYSFTDWLDLTAGARYQKERRNLIVSNVEYDGLAGGTPALIAYAPRRDTRTNLSPRVSLEVRPFDDVMVYTSYSKGFKSATYNIVNIYAQPDFVKPEKVDSIELGVKSDLFDRNVRFNAAVFQTKIKDLQTAFVSLTSGGAVNFENAGKAKIKGVEFDATIVPLPSIDQGLVLTASASWLNAKYTDYPDGNGYDENTGIAFESRDFSGNRIARTPKFTASATVSQTIETGLGPLEIAADVYRNNGFYFTPQNSDVSFEPKYTVVGARVSYLYDPWDMRLTLFGTNLTDERYNVQQFHTDFGREDQLAPPRAYGVRLNWNF